MTKAFLDFQKWASSQPNYFLDPFKVRTAKIDIKIKMFFHSGSRSYGYFLKWADTQPN